MSDGFIVITGTSRGLGRALARGFAAAGCGRDDTEMLRTAWVDGAAAYPPAGEWAERAVPYLLSLGPEHNGRSLSVPG